MPDFAALERYRPLVDDWPAFVEALRRPLPACLWVNTARGPSAAVATFLAERGVPLMPLAWRPDAFKTPWAALDEPSLPYRAGAYHIQEEVSLLPVALLDPQPGERVLDLCAAPGNKTAQIALAMRNTGTVVANDRSGLRARAITGNLNRLGVMNAAVTVCDGANYPAESGSFDRVLVDVPCSCEGTSRKHPGVLEEAGRARSMALRGTQQALLRKAVQRCRPGGRIVYSTCTYAPEENECVVDTIVREFGESVLHVLSARVDGLTGDPGITTWAGRQLLPALANTLRVWPHQNDSGGFFVAVLEKTGPATHEDRHEAAYLDLPFVDTDRWTATHRERFGLPSSIFDGLSLLRKGKKYVAAVAEHPALPRKPALQTIGMNVIRAQLRYPKLTTSTAMALGHHATRNVIEVDRRQADTYHARQDVHPGREQLEDCTGEGYVILRYRRWSLGVGLLRFRPDGPVVRSLFPKAWSIPAPETP